MYYDSLIKFLSDFFKENSITEKEDGTFLAGDKSFAIKYNEATKCYDLLFAESGEDFKTVSSYLFDETQTEKDVESVAIDFTDTLRKKLSIAAKRSASSVALPTAQGGDKCDLNALTQKLLAIFPANKETYKAHVADNNRFLATAFYKEYLIPDITALLVSGNKKQVKKFCDAVIDIFVHSDDEAAAYSVGAVAAACHGNSDSLALVKEYSDECPTFYSNVLHFSNKLKASKKTRDALIK
ncbi:MAG: hypothetical protein E7568_03120 [Ruminococcaceae bacterium]|nr:hypothetical protein [Oscillospiraceae bacterium]